MPADFSYGGKEKNANIVVARKSKSKKIAFGSHHSG